MHFWVSAHKLRAAVVAALILVFAAFGIWFQVAHWRPSPADYPVQGIDVSEDQGAIDWWPVRNDGAQFAYIRATSGAEVRDARFAENWPAASSAGIRRGALHRYSLCQPAARQAGNFISTVPRVDNQLPPAVEIDFTTDCAVRPERAALVAELGQFLAAIEIHLGQPAILKTSSAVDAEYHLADAFDRILWGQRSFFSPSYFARPWTIWQATTFRRIDGVSGPVNWDVMAR